MTNNNEIFYEQQDLFAVNCSLPRRLGDRIRRLDLKIGYRRHRYEVGEVLSYEVKAVAPTEKLSLDVEIEKYAGSGFAGQVYRVRVVPGEGAARRGRKRAAA